VNRWWSTCTRWAEKIRDVRQRTDAQEGKGGGDVVDFQVEVRKHAATEKGGVSWIQITNVGIITSTAADQ